MKHTQKGFTLVELLIVLVIGLVLVTIVMEFFANNMGWTEDRAKDNAKLFVSENNITTSRMSCAGDSDHDGYGSCTVVTTADESINLQCPTDFLQVKIFGAKGCKEITGQQKFIIRR